MTHFLITTDSLAPQNQTPDAPGGLYILHTVIALYGVGFGVLLIAGGMFVGMHIVAAGSVHVLIGVGFIASAFGISHGNRSSYTLGYILAAAVATISLIALASSVRDSDLASAIVWGGISMFFILVAFVTRSAAPSVPQESSDPNGRT